MTLLDVDSEAAVNPVDMIELLAAANDWTFERGGDDEITISVSGHYSEYNVSITWMDEIESLHVACAFDMKVSEVRTGEVLKLLNRVNERMWVGHFDLWTEEDVVMYRHALLLPDDLEPTPQQCEALISNAIEACERHYQAFQFVVWSGKSAKEALEAVLFETMGEA